MAAGINKVETASRGKGDPEVKTVPPKGDSKVETVSLVNGFAFVNVHVTLQEKVHKYM